MTESFPLPQGFTAAGVYCGIKSDARKRDLALFVSEREASAAGVFTQNRVVGAPVKVSRERVPGKARAVLINSGNSNACTGDRGVEDARWMTAETARRLDCPADQVLVCSTGVIGRFLPRESLERGFPQVVAALGHTPEHFLNANQGMLTTDTVTKQSTRELQLNGQTVRVSGAAKGAAMIAPNMATMLGVVLTDAQLTPTQADVALRTAVDHSFNCISVDGHTSTSDTVLLLANAAAGTGPLKDDDLRAICRAIDEVCQELAQAIIRDAEGAGHFVTVDVRGCRDAAEARQIAKAICDGMLVKSAITGNDPNWGRIISAAGYCGINVTEQEMSLWINGAEIYRAGTPVNFDAGAVSQSMKGGEVHLELTCTRGNSDVRYWTTDLTAEYVRLNSEYTT